jgi:outer membrane protein assembly factor BamB
MHKLRSLSVGLGVLALVAAATAQFDGPAPLAWRSVQPTSVAPGGSPVVDGDNIYQAIGGRIYCLDRTTGNKRWQFPQVEQIPGVFRNSPVLANGTLIAVGDNRIAYAIDAATGASKWSANLPTGSLGAPVLAGNMVVVALSDNSLTAFNVADGAPAWPNPYKVYDGLSGTLSSFGNNVLLFTNRQELVSLNTTTQKVAWHQRFSQLPPTPAATVSGETIYTNSGPFLIALNANSGTARWQASTQMQLVFSPVVSPTGVMVVSQDGKVMVYDPSTRQAITKKPLDLGSLPIVQPTAAGNGKFIVPTANGAINLIDPTQVDSQWNYVVRPIGEVTAQPNNASNPGRGVGSRGATNTNNAPEKITSIQASAPAVVAGQTLIVPARDGSILAFDKNLGVDLTPPKVEMLFPNPGDQVSGQPPLLLLFRVDDEASGLKTGSVKVEVNGQALEHTLNKDGTVIVRFSMTGKNRPLADGRKEIVVTAMDWMGNEIKKTFALTIDNALNPIKLPGQDTTNPGGLGGGVKGGGLGGGLGGDGG